MAPSTSVLCGGYLGMCGWYSLVLLKSNWHCLWTILVASTVIWSMCDSFFFARGCTWAGKNGPPPPNCQMNDPNCCCCFCLFCFLERTQAIPNNVYCVQIPLLWFVCVHGVCYDLYAQFYTHPYVGRCHTMYKLHFSVAKLSVAAHSNGELHFNALRLKKISYHFCLLHWDFYYLWQPMEQSEMAPDFVCAQSVDVKLTIVMSSTTMVCFGVTPCKQKRPVAFQIVPLTVQDNNSPNGAIRNGCWFFCSQSIEAKLTIVMIVLWWFDLHEQELTRVHSSAMSTFYWISCIWCGCGNYWYVCGNCTAKWFVCDED